MTITLILNIIIPRQHISFTKTSDLAVQYPVCLTTAFLKVFMVMYKYTQYLVMVSEIFFQLQIAA